VASEADRFIDLQIDLSVEALEAVTHLYFFTRILWNLSPSLGSAGLATAVFGTSASLILGRARLARLFREERKAQGTFSHTLSRCRENLESIQFAGGVDYELKRIDALDDARQKATAVRKREKDLISMFSLMLRRLAGGVLPSLILRREHEEGNRHSHDHHHHHGHSHSKLTPNPTHGNHPKPLTKEGGGEEDEMVSELAQATEAFDEILYHLLIVTENFHNATRLVTIGKDICALLEREGQNSAVVMDCSKHLTLLSRDIKEDEDWLQVKDLTVKVPSGNQEVLLDDFSLTIKHGDSVLVTGVSGTGKTALLRVLFGLWPAAKGTVTRPDDSRMIILPQKPFCSSGTLAEQISYPRPPGDFSQEAIRDALKAVGLGHLLERYRLDSVEKWQEQLSMGEQQRIGFSRVALHRPEFAFLDESSSNLDLESEARMYDLVCRTVRGGFLSIGHRKSIEKYHLQKIVVYGPQGEGKWKREY